MAPLSPVPVVHPKAKEDPKAEKRMQAASLQMQSLPSTSG